MGSRTSSRGKNAAPEPSRDILHCLHGDPKQTENPRGYRVIIKPLTLLPGQMLKRKTQKTWWWN